MLQGDLGMSMTDPIRPQLVNDIVGDRILFTILLSTGTILFTWSLAIPIGVYSAVKQYSPGDYMLTFLGFVGMSIPGFLLALLVMYWGGRFFDMDLTGFEQPELEEMFGIVGPEPLGFSDDIESGMVKIIIEVMPECWSVDSMDIIDKLKELQKIYKKKNFTYKINE